jgi:hypothetical protein
MGCPFSLVANQGHQGQVSVSPNSRTILRPLNPDGDMLLPKKLNIFVPKDTGTDVYAYL